MHQQCALTFKDTDQVLVGVLYTRLQSRLRRVHQHCHEYESERAAPSHAMYKASTEHTQSQVTY